MLQSLNRGLEILEYMAITHNGASVTELAHVFSVNKSTISRIVAVLIDHGLVYREEKTGRLRLGTGSLMYSYHVMSDYHILDFARPIIARLAAETCKTSHLATLHGDILYVMDHVKHEDNRHMKDPTIPGMLEPVYCTAVGKVLLAFMDPTEARGILERVDRPIYTPNTVTDVDAIMDLLPRIRNDGYAMDCEELRSNVFCVAVPIFVNQQAVSSIGLTGTINFAQNPEHLRFCISKLQSAAAELSQNLCSSKV